MQIIEKKISELKPYEDFTGKKAVKIDETPNKETD